MTTQRSSTPRPARRAGALALSGLALLAGGCGTATPNMFAGTTDGVPNGIPSGEPTTVPFVSTTAAAAAAAAEAKAQAATSSASTTPATPAAPAVPTPKSGPLSREPTIAKGVGAPPKVLVEKDLVKGTGAVAADGKTLTVNYVGALFATGKVFDASWERDTTFPFVLGVSPVIKGWDEGILGMKVGGRRELIIPAALAYGAAGRPPLIPASSTLIFDVDLLKVS